jgi:glutamyl-Q tRNA(Asp) synthetase
VWGIARALGGRVLLRLEDHDRGRCRPEYESALLEDLEWLGLEPDLGAPDTFRRGASPLRQSDRAEAYESALKRLASAAPVYACTCSRKDIEGDPDAPDRETRYPGRCRTLGLAMEPGRGIRVALDPGVEHFTDVLMGDQQQDPSTQCGDLLVRDRTGNWTYQFAVTVDDLEQEIDLVIRGMDLLSSTGRQIRLSRLLGRARPPVFVHHPLALHPTGAKLSKANRDTGIRDLRQSGASPSSVLGQAAFLSRLLTERRDLRPDELPQLFARYEVHR